MKRLLSVGSAGVVLLTVIGLAACTMPQSTPQGPAASATTPNPAHNMSMIGQTE